MSRNRAERRHNDWVKSHRKVEIIKNIYNDESWYDAVFAGKEHRLSKEKVHCSCPICSAKTNRNGYKISDLKKLEALQSSLDEEDYDLKILPKHKEW